MSSLRVRVFRSSDHFHRLRVVVNHALHEVDVGLGVADLRRDRRAFSAEISFDGWPGAPGCTIGTGVCGGCAAAAPGTETAATSKGVTNRMSLNRGPYSDAAHARCQARRRTSHYTGLMDEGRPSRTAMRVAMRRAAHQIFDTPLVLDDPVAVRIIGEPAVARIHADPRARAGRLARASRAWMVARSRFAEDEMARAVGRGARQYVVLGAGLDTFAYRSAFADVRVFEVDHPATQAWKRKRIAAGAITVPSSVTYVPVDFERQRLADCLDAAGFNRSAPAFFSWLGVVMYLTRPAIDATLDVIGSTAPGGGVAFDYAVAWSRLGWWSLFGSWRLARRVAAAGEPFRTRFRPDTLNTILESFGFSRITDLGRDEINQRYFAARHDGVRVRGEGGRLLSAET